MSTNKTANYELNQWELNDKPVMDEFNEDNKKIDAELSKKANLDGASFTGNVTVDGSQVAVIETLKWINLTLAEGIKWLFSPAQYTKDGLSFVRLRGYLLRSDNGKIQPGDIIGYLPIGYYNKNPLNIPVPILNGDFENGNKDLGVLNISGNGVLSLGKSQYVAGYTGGGVSLEGVSFSPG